MAPSTRNWLLRGALFSSLLTLAALASAQDGSLAIRGPGAIVLHGTVEWNQPNVLTYVADLKTFANAKVKGVSAADLMTFRGDRFNRQAALFAAAQVAGGTPRDKVQPLYVLLDPASDWAYGVPWATFSYTRDGATVGPVTAPMLKIGEQLRMTGNVSGNLPEVRDLNRTLTELARGFWTEQLAARTPKVVRGKPAPLSQPDFDQEVLRGSTFTLSAGGGAVRKVDLEGLAGEAVPATFLRWLKSSVVGSLRANGDPANGGGWDEFERSDGVQRVLKGAQQLAAQAELAEAACHELGHLIHFASLGLYGYKGWGSAPHMDGSSHSLTTLSTPKFAFIEGFAISNSMVLLNMPAESAPGEANRIDYSSTAAYVRSKTNQKAHEVVTRVLREVQVLAPAASVAAPQDSLTPDQYLEALGATVRGLGVTEEQWTQVSAQAARDAELAELRRSDAYLQELQARAGQLRSRYDFLRSEYAVAAAIAKIRNQIGDASTALFLVTMAKRKPETFAEAFEAFAHDQPQLRADLYRLLAKVTEGILVTAEQAEWVAKQAEPYEIDIDRDGRVPGLSAGGANPSLFRAEPPPTLASADPLGAGAADAGTALAKPEPGRSFGPDFEREGPVTVTPLTLAGRPVGEAAAPADLTFDDLMGR